MSLDACPRCAVLIDSERGHWCAPLTEKDKRFLRAIRVSGELESEIDAMRQADESRWGGDRSQRSIYDRMKRDWTDDDDGKD